MGATYTSKRVPNVGLPLPLAASGLPRASVTGFRSEGADRVGAASLVSLLLPVLSTGSTVSAVDGSSRWAFSQCKDPTTAGGELLNSAAGFMPADAFASAMRMAAAAACAAVAGLEVGGAISDARAAAPSTCRRGISCGR